MTTPAEDCCGTVLLRGPTGPAGPEGPPGPPGVADVYIGTNDPITVTGSGTEADPFVIALTVSADPGNLVETGTDGGLYVGRQQDLLCLADTEIGVTPEAPDEGVCLYADNGALRTINPNGYTSTLRPLPATSTRIDPDTDPETLYVEGAPGGKTVMQSFAVDNYEQQIFSAQVMPSGIQLDDEPAPVDYTTRQTSGDIQVSRISLDGTLLDYMYVRGVGHGTQIGVDTLPDGTTNIWTGTDSSSGGHSRSVGYLPYAASTTTAVDNADLPRFQPFGTFDAGVSVNIDPTTRRLVYARDTPGGTATDDYTLFDVEDAYAGVWHPIGQVTVSFNNMTNQGHTAAGNYLYSWTGDSLETEPSGNSTVRVYDIPSGQLVSTTLVTALLGEVTYREAEGISVWLPDLSCPTDYRLVAGYACSESGARTASLIYWNVCGSADSITSVTAADNTVTVTPTTGDVTIAANVSADADNTLTAGADGGLFVPATSAIGEDSYTFGPTIERTGSGTTTDSYVVGVNISTDPGNAVTTGTDSGLYVPAVTAGEGIEITGGPSSALVVTSRGYVQIGTGQDTALDGSTTAFPTEWTSFAPEVWAAIDTVAPFTGYVKITIGARCVNNNSDSSTLYAGWEQTFNGDTTLPSNYRSFGVVGCGVNGTRSRIYAVTTGMTVTLTPAFRASSYSTTAGVTLLDSGSLNAEFFAA